MLNKHVISRSIIYLALAAWVWCCSAVYTTSSVYAAAALKETSLTQPFFVVAKNNLRQVLLAQYVPAHTAVTVDQETTKQPLELHWEQLHPGLTIGSAILPESAGETDARALTIVKINPDYFSFTLLMASEDGQPRSFADWSRKYNLLAAINASMYLPDNMTSTGHMRNANHVNNPKQGTKLGAFFVAEPQNTHSPPADILEVSDQHFTNTLSAYAIAVQNYRLINNKGRILWPDAGEKNSIAAIGNDSDSNILFILCQEPLTAGKFAKYLQQFSLNLKTVMYVEGGSQAGIILDKPAIIRDAQDLAIHTSPAITKNSNTPPEHSPYTILKGRQSLFNTKGNDHGTIPNIIGIVPRKRQ